MDDINIALKNYSVVGKNFSVEKTEKGLGQATSIIEVDQNKYLLKRYSDKPLLEIALNDFLKLKNVSVPSINKNDSGEEYTEANGKYYVLWEFIEGEPVKNPLNLALITNLAIKVSDLHKTLLEFNTDDLRNNYHYKIENQGWFSDSIKEKVSILESQIKENECRKALIHGDLTKQNVFVSADQVEVKAFIDFGDMHKDLIAWDMAVIITQVMITKTYGIEWEPLEKFWKKYNELFTLNQSEKEAIVPMLILRNYRLYQEVEDLMENADSDKEELESIKGSVLTKIEMIEENQEKLQAIFLS